MPNRLTILTDYLSGEFAAEPFVFPGWIKAMMQPAALAGSEPVRDALNYILFLEGEVASLKARITVMDKERLLRKAIETDIDAALKMQSVLMRSMMRGGHLEGTIWQHEKKQAGA